MYLNNKKKSINELNKSRKLYKPRRSNHLKKVKEILFRVEKSMQKKSFDADTFIFLYAICIAKKKK